MTRTLLSLALLTALTIAAGLGAYQSADVLLATAGRLERDHKILDGLVHLDVLVKDAEAGAGAGAQEHGRSSAVDAGSRALAIARAESVRRRVTGLRVLVGDDPRRRSMLRALGLAALAATATDPRSMGSGSGPGKTIRAADEFRGLSRQMEAEVREGIDRCSIEAAVEARRAHLTQYLLLVASGLPLGLVYLLVRREVLALELARENARLVELAATDGLTGLKNRRHLLDSLREALAFARRHHLPLSLVLFDLDHFKSYNDAFGHPAGDEALCAVARVVLETTRGHDVSARYGGEEFALLLPSTDAAGARVIAERLRAEVAGHLWPLRRMTASFGVATLLGATADATTLLEHADQALYLSKRRGRDQVTHYDDPPVVDLSPSFRDGADAGLTSVVMAVPVASS